MLIKVEAIVREEKFEEIKDALNKIQVNGITVSQVMGCGAQRGYKERVRGSEFRRSHTPEKSATERSSAMRSEAP